MSSIAVAGLYDEGTFNEDMFDEGQKLAHPYHRTKFESEKLVRERVKSRGASTARAVVVGDSQTGEMDKIDGPYYFFKVIQKIRHALPEWFPLISLEWGWTNIVPSTTVPRRRPHRPRGRPRRQAFHIVGPEGPALATC
jgi:thioester reductase-like protein